MVQTLPKSDTQVMTAAGRKTVLVLGAGYAGLTAALRLANKVPADRWQVVLVNKTPYHLLETRLHQAAARNTDVTIPLAKIIRGRGIRLHLATVTGVDLDRRQVTTDRGVLGYDALIIALGSTTNFYGIPGLAEGAFQLKSLDDARLIRERVARQFGYAASEPDEAKRRDLLRVVIGGGGLTGVELAAELADTVHEAAKQYQIDPNEAEIVIVDALPTILPTLEASLRDRAVADLEAKNIRIVTNTKVTGLDGNRLAVNPGEPITAGTFVWTGGVRAVNVITSAPPKLGSLGRIVVDEYLRLPDHPEVYVVGDEALATDPKTGQPVPPAAQFALQQGNVAADNIARTIEGEALKPYQPKLLGELVSLGKHLAVGYIALGWLGKVRFAGILADIAKQLNWKRELVILSAESHNPIFG